MSSPTDGRMQPAKKNRISLLIALSIFILPALFAYLAHLSGFWALQGSTNFGQLITPPLNFDELKLSRNDTKKPFDRGQQWWIVYAPPKVCDQACQNSLYQIRQTQTATGAEQKRVATLLIHHQNSDKLARSWAQQHAPKMQQVQVDEQQWNQLIENIVAGKNTIQPSQAGEIYLVDPMGAIFMRYPSQADEKASIQQGKGMLKDLQRVLKYSRIG